ncbi:MarR family winged helix-turn-helix transcriptional regulator [Streptomonospora salina]|uniref:DNA-binding MarR family transcriptional regulator n=1 Tax=Streptomonospora salina TaxID=104205 RepID=A0A841ED14_9ACTN|nr:MarR family transcriptional regulator [Streptomonospora salina]MBB5998858.1 DNA-binding MarR family transcriptional regulator [Streptomonospora salina]
MVSGFPPPLLGRLSFLLGKLHLLTLEAEDEGLAQLDVGVKQHAALSVLVGEGPMTQQELGRRMGVDRTTVVGVVDALDERELVERRRSPADRRSNLLTVTASGHETEQRGRRLVADAEERVLDGLDGSDRDRLRELLGRALGGG